MIKTTTQNSHYWRQRQIDWNQAYFTPEHPHRQFFVELLRKMRWGSLVELGCAAGANLHVIQQAFPRADLGGVDVSATAIAEAKKHANNKVLFDVAPAHKVFLQTKSIDVVITDMMLIYQGPLMIKKTLNEIKRLARREVILCEFHHPNFFMRQGLRLKGYNAYNYEKLLASMDFYDISTYKISAAMWPGGEPQKTFGYFIRASL